MDSQCRQEYIRAAISFLQNPKLSDSSLKDKLQFLRNKGLTEIEVDEALNLALINRQTAQHGRWNFLLVLGLCVGAFRLYQAYLDTKKDVEIYPERKQENMRYQTPSTSKGNMQVALKGKDNSSDKDNEKQIPVVEIFEKISELKRLIELQRSNFASDIQSLKTLLLDHKTFAAPPVVPAWQLEVSEKVKSSNKPESEKSEV